MDRIKICLLKKKAENTNHSQNHISSNRGKKEFADRLGHKEHQSAKDIYKNFAAKGLIQFPSDPLIILPILKLVIILSEKEPNEH